MAGGRGGRRDRWCAVATVTVALWTGTGCDTAEKEDAASQAARAVPSSSTTTAEAAPATTTTTMTIASTEVAAPPETRLPPATTMAPAPATTSATPTPTTTTRPPAPATTAPPTTEATPLGGPAPDDVPPGTIAARTAVPSYVISGGANPMPAGFEAPVATSTQALGCTRVGPDSFLYRYDVVATGGRDWRMPPPPDGAPAGVHELRIDGLPGPFTVRVTSFWVLHVQGYPASRVELPSELQLRIPCA